MMEAKGHSEMQGGLMAISKVTSAMTTNISVREIKWLVCSFHFYLEQESALLQNLELNALRSNPQGHRVI